MVPENIVRWKDQVHTYLTSVRYGGDITDDLILALIWQESSGNQWAYNPEPRYKWLWNVKTDKPYTLTTKAQLMMKIPPPDFPHLAGDKDQEWWGQQASWGLLQIMGAAAREQGFNGPYLTQLCDPYVNIEYATKHLYHYASRENHFSIEETLLRYNGGGNPDFANQVLSKQSQLSNERIS